MKELFKEIQEIDKKNSKPTEKALCKLFEEAGEFAQAVNMTIDMKSTDLTPEQVMDKIAEEGADAIQNIFCVANKCGVSYKSLTEWLSKKNDAWKQKIETGE